MVSIIPLKIRQKELFLIFTGELITAGCVSLVWAVSLEKYIHSKKYKFVHIIGRQYIIKLICT